MGEDRIKLALLSSKWNLGGELGLNWQPLDITASVLLSELTWISYVVHVLCLG